MTWLVAFRDGRRVTPGSVPDSQGRLAPREGKSVFRLGADRGGQDYFSPLCPAGLSRRPGRDASRLARGYAAPAARTILHGQRARPVRPGGRPVRGRSQAAAKPRNRDRKAIRNGSRLDFQSDLSPRQSILQDDQTLDRKLPDPGPVQVGGKGEQIYENSHDIATDFGRRRSGCSNSCSGALGAAGGP